MPQPPKCLFVLYIFSFSRDHSCENVIVVAVFVNFARIALHHVHDRGIAENGTSWILTSFWE